MEARIRAHRRVLPAILIMSLWVKYDADGDFRGPSLGAGVQAVARQGDNNSSFRLPGYAMAMYRFQPAHLPVVKNPSFQLNVRNLLDETYYTGATCRNAIIPGAPRTFISSMRAEF